MRICALKNKKEFKTNKNKNKNFKKLTLVDEDKQFSLS